MAVKKEMKIHNKSDKPDNIIMKEIEITEKCQAIEEELPRFLKGFFTYLKGNVLPMTRLAYLQDIRFFCNYLIQETDLTIAPKIRDIKLEDFDQIKAVDVNIFIDYCRRYKVEKEKAVYIYENDKKSLSRKKSSISVLFKHLYRDELVSRNITDGFDPIKLPKPGEREIKALQEDEVMRMLDAVSSGDHLTKKEHEFWMKTKKRDKAILILFLTYGLRLSELQQLNLSSFHFKRGEFKIYRKRGKESIMPLNQSVIKVLSEYINEERPAEEKLAEENKDALFLSLQGKRMTERQIRELVKKYTSIGLSTSRAAGYSPHKLRATTATSLIGRGNSIFDVQALLDHENITTTQLYAAHKLNVKRDLVKNFEWEEEFDKNKKDNDSSNK
ncbi:tyrosine-type recombinase/integrase [Sinanaerobacter chloroacetimidivorans]|uniref:Tyrosine-type recombinase/integrase n=1 Tax=Sinanaerobacter chloroacetimidivorans TaxID=2818044 RepID=A0A8J7VX06_9FIRM|nr:tyrosine-type recombinase/integrase [Sinanaerobacter chloroacetimidivorans]MBR0596612.1 tyrosine-type recombinase/integrase [Sinanaerobacter chloroacetimidivorans]